MEHGQKANKRLYIHPEPVTMYSSAIRPILEYAASV